MGNCIAVDGTAKKRKISKIIQNYDFTGAPGADFTFAMRFARENTNDKGERLSLGSAQYIIRQFKLYIEMVWEALQL